MKTHLWWHAALFGICLSLVPACQSADKPESEGSPLRVGVVPDNPPLVFLQNEALAGAEIDLAQLLGKALGRPAKFFVREWDGLIEDLLSGKVDIIMSGLSITDARKVRIAFTDPYFESGLMAMMRREDMAVYTNAAAVLACSGVVGAKVGTTGAAFTEQHLKSARTMALATPETASYELKRRRIDLFIHDGPALAWMVSSDESAMGLLRERLTKEQIAWGLRLEDEALRADVNRALATWKTDGTLERVLKRWMPYLHKTGE